MKSKSYELVNQTKILREKETSYECLNSNLKKENFEKIKIIDNKVNFQVKQLEFEYKQQFDKMTEKSVIKDKKIDKVTFN